jgi:hypothetical protein
VTPRPSPPSQRTLSAERPLSATDARKADAFTRLCDWFGDTFGESPRGLAWFAATLFPLCVAAFVVGYFGLRELLAVV